MRYFDQELVANSRPHAAWWGEVGAEREAFHRAETGLASIAAATGLRANASAILPRDAWLEMDAITKRVMRDDGGQAFMADLMPLARPIHIGKLAFGYRISSDAGTVRRSMSGQVPEVLGKTDYDYRRAIVPIFHTGYGRAWREWSTLQSENFDALADDQESHTAKIREDMAAYALDGDASLTFEGTAGYGIRTHPFSKAINLGSAAGGANINLATANADALDAFFGFAPSSSYIRPLVGMAVNTTAAVRLNPTSDYNFLVMGAMGVDIRADWNGKSGVFYSTVVN